MTDKEKIKAYDEALERAKDYHKQLLDEDNPEWAGEIEKIFPELKESKEEWIEKLRKEIITFLGNKKVSSINESDAINVWIAWLEKQESLTIDEEKQGKEDVLWCIKQAKKYAKDENEMGTCWFAEQWLEKQGNKPQGKKALEAAKEEKVDNANKVEPKFNEGDWLCEIEPNNYARFIQILEIVNIQGKERYRISRDIHNDEDIVEFDFVEKYYHKFDIIDAKDGDVLSNGKMIVIFKHFEEPSYRQHIVAYIGLDTNGDIQVTNDTWNLGIDKTKPATKEQRNLLFQKMKENGYEWNDKEKKPIKSEVSLPSFDEQQGTPIIAYNKEHCQNAAWSEVDKDFMYNTLSNLTELKDRYGEGYGNVGKCIDWLKSLSPQNRWKPSEEQIIALRWVLNNIPYNKHKEEISGLLDQIKDL